jgi:hypothetical protein
MNRRTFITGLVASAGVTATGSLPAVIDTATFDMAIWRYDFNLVMTEHLQNLIAYGVSGLMYTNTYPYVECIWPGEMYVNPHQR